MRLQQLQLILALTQAGSLHAAAEMLNVSQPALTKSLRQLEEELGTPLMIRSPRGMRLAPAGELLAARAANVMREIQRARDDIAWYTRQGAGSVKLGLSPGAAIHLTPAAIARFEARWPQVRIHAIDTLYPTMLAQLRAGEIDLAIGPLPDGDIGHDLRLHPLFTSQHVIAARDGHPLVQTHRLAELADTAWVLTGPEGGPGDPAHLDFARFGLPSPHVRLVCESFATVLALLPALDVLAVMPRRFFDRYGPRLGLHMLAIKDPLPCPTIHILWRADGPLSVPAQRLRDVFIHEAELDIGGVETPPPQ
ncbi:MAG: LysR substrate-binding domain-containing protein [Pigmentiphaga sp.]